LLMSSESRNPSFKIGKTTCGKAFSVVNTWRKLSLPNGWSFWACHAVPMADLLKNLGFIDLVRRGVVVLGTAGDRGKIGGGSAVGTWLVPTRSRGSGSDSSGGA